tara:strand:+ start:42 stop:1616 length:1575 start_codon:yes stop_codon:yes gene_type:complete
MRYLLIIFSLFLFSCTPTNQKLFEVNNNSHQKDVTIVLNRENRLTGAAIPFYVWDGGVYIGRIGPGGTLKWNRSNGPFTLQLTVRNDWNTQSWSNMFWRPKEPPSTFILAPDKTYTFTVKPNGQIIEGENNYYLNVEDIKKTRLGDWEKTNLSKEDFKEYFENNLYELNEIEGIWRHSSKTLVTAGGNSKLTENTGNYILAIVKDSTQKGYYNGWVLESNREGWEKGDLKVFYREINYPVYEQNWYMGDFSIEKKDVILKEKSYFEWEAISTNYLPKYRTNRTVSNNSILLKTFPNQEHSSKEEESSSGSGFLLSKDGYVVTNYHVISGKDTLLVNFPSLNISNKASVIVKDKKNDIAILKLIDFNYNDFFNIDIPYILGETKNVSPGQEIFTIGFPLGDVMGKTPRFSEGTINSLYGLDDDAAQFQISVPLQPGNSGGALFNKNGELIGIVVSGLDAKMFSDYLGIVPQNVNFAIKINYLKNLITMLPNSEAISNRNSNLLNLNKEKQVERLTPFIVQIRNSK